MILKLLKLKKFNLKMIRSNQPSSLIKLLENTKTSKPGQMDFRTEYTDKFNKIGSEKYEK